MKLITMLLGTFIIVALGIITIKAQTTPIPTNIEIPQELLIQLQALGLGNLELGASYCSDGNCVAKVINDGSTNDTIEFFEGSSPMETLTNRNDAFLDWLIDYPNLPSSTILDPPPATLPANPVILNGDVAPPIGTD